MAYFPNGTSGMIWDDENCAHCIHNNPDEAACPIWMAHQLFNYDQCDDTDKGKALREVLDMLIPTPEGQLHPGPCPMLVHKTPSHKDWMDGTDVIPCKKPLMVIR